MPHAKESSEFYPWPEIFKHHIIYVTQPLELANLEDAYVILFFMSETKVNGNLRHVIKTCQQPGIKLAVLVQFKAM